MNARELARALTGGSPTGAGSLIYSATQARRKGDTRTAAILEAASKELAARDQKRSAGNGAHPRDAAHLRPTRDRGPLKPSDLAWLSGIATRAPGSLSFEDATAVAEILGSLGSDDRSDRRYVESIWRPIDEHHTRRIAEARLAQVKQVDSTLPEGTLDVVAKALAGELGGEFTEDEIRTRAKTLVDEAAANHAAQLSSRAATAQEKLDKLTAAQAEREQVYR